MSIWSKDPDPVRAIIDDLCSVESSRLHFNIVRVIFDVDGTPKLNIDLVDKVKLYCVVEKADELSLLESEHHVFLKILSKLKDFDDVKEMLLEREKELAELRKQAVEQEREAKKYWVYK